ncbi:MAG: hypothetical protein HC896_17730 [Bacteroidales bacterium]|nr:hypothetical protein [Bacteroidales bacterium]
MKALSDAENQLKEKAEALKKELVTLANNSIPTLTKARTILQNQFDFSEVRLSSDKHADDKLMVLEGWVPKENEKNLLAYLETTHVYFEGKDPEKEDKVPVKLKNTSFASLFESIGTLFSLPNYKELDLTPFFAPFFAFSLAFA